LLSEIITDLAPSIKKRNAEVVVNKLPTISVQRTWIRQLFVNLIDNGLKFNKSSTPRVKVLCDVRTKDYLFSVRDNGIGIEDQYHERIFNLFERLHSREEFDGTGAGLAISKKIVQNLGGRIWVESAPKEGSSFFFTIPRK
jgi:light-regulated signal transduction histidine kinase (bacteriophytochrome)